MGTTPVYGIPYVEASDLLNTYPPTMKAQSEAIEAALSTYATPRAARYKSANQTLTTASSFATITFDGDEANGTGINYSGGVFTITRAGVYEINVIVHFSPTVSTSSLRLVLNINGATKAYSIGGTPMASMSVLLSKSWRCAAGDEINVQASSSAANQVVYGASARYTVIDITLIAP